MKRIILTAPILALGLTLFQPGSVFAKGGAQDNGQRDPKGKAVGKASQPTVASAPRGDRGQARFRGSPPVVPAPSQAPRTSPDRFRGAPPQQGVATVRPSPGRTRTPQTFAPSAVRNPQVVPSPSPSVTQSTRTLNSNRVRSGAPQFDYRSFNRSNAYGGRWVASELHRSWDRNRRHHWNNHDWRWYDGGWLIVDGGFWPPDFYGPYPHRDLDSYSTDYASSATVSAVQQKLTDLGYYNDYVDGIIGPHTRDAIAQYQRDFGLRVTGAIDVALLRSLGLT